MIQGKPEFCDLSLRPSSVAGNEEGMGERAKEREKAKRPKQIRGKRRSRNPKRLGPSSPICSQYGR